MFNRRAEGAIYDSVYTKSHGWITHYYMYMTPLIAVKGGEMYTWRISADTSSGSSRLTDITTVYYDKDLNEIGCASHGDSVRYYSFTVPQNCAYVRCPTSRVEGVDKESMLNVGSSPLPYEEYYAPYYDTVSYAKSITGAQTYTKFPIVLRTTEQSIPTWNVKGNMQQAGTPTPTSPITPSECGERTENLFDMEAATDSAYINSSGTITYNDAWSVSDYISVESLIAYTISRITDQPSTAACHAFYDANKSLISTIQAEVSTQTFETPINAKYIRCSWRSAAIQQVMLNSGSTAKPYEPYGCKLPIVSGGVTTNIYLSEPIRKIGDYADTIAADGTVTRKIKKVVITGEESGWAMSGTGLFYNLTLPDNPKEMSAVVSTHFTATTNTISVEIGRIRFGGTVQNPTQPLVFNYDDGAIGLTAFKQWLSAQYAAGTPVTVWYVLETPTTETTTTSAISTTSGLNTIDVATTLKPSEMSLTYDGYKLCKRQRYSRTAQLFNYNTSEIGAIDSNGEDAWSDSARRSDYIQVKGGSTYTLSGNGGNIRFFVYDENKNYLNDNFLYSAPFTISNNGYIRFAGGLSSVIDTIMLNEGSTAKPYQPYLDWE